MKLALLLSVIFVLLSTTSPAAEAGIFSRCLGALGFNVGGPKLTALQKKHLSQLTATERQFVERKAKGKGNPPVSHYSASSSPIYDLYFGFGYWWFPGNIWHSLIFPTYPSYGAEVASQYHDTRLNELYEAGKHLSPEQVVAIVGESSNVDQALEDKSVFEDRRSSSDVVVIDSTSALASSPSATVAEPITQESSSWWGRSGSDSSDSARTTYSDPGSSYSDSGGGGGGGGDSGGGGGGD